MPSLTSNKVLDLDRHIAESLLTAETLPDSTTITGVQNKRKRAAANNRASKTNTRSRTTLNPIAASIEVDAPIAAPNSPLTTANASVGVAQSDNTSYATHLQIAATSMENQEASNTPTSIAAATSNKVVGKGGGGKKKKVNKVVLSQQG